MEILYNESEIPENFVCGIQNPSSTDNTGIQYLYWVPSQGAKEL